MNFALFCHEMVQISFLIFSILKNLMENFFIEIFSIYLLENIRIKIFSSRGYEGRNFKYRTRSVSEIWYS